MQITEVKVSYTRRVDLGNYESATATVTVGGLVEEGDDPEQVVKDLFALATQGVRDKLKPLVDATRAKPEDLAQVEFRVAGKPVK